VKTYSPMDTILNVIARCFGNKDWSEYGHPGCSYFLVMDVEAGVFRIRRR
jgi:hypothetical protein